MTLLDLLKNSVPVTAKGYPIIIVPYWRDEKMYEALCTLVQESGAYEEVGSGLLEIDMFGGDSVLAESKEKLHKINDGEIYRDLAKSAYKNNANLVLVCEQETVRTLNIHSLFYRRIMQ